MRRLGPALQHPQLWHIGRRCVASGAAVGLFFGILLPIGQIPSAAAFAVLLRANVAAATAGTFITNPVTYVPVYLAAYVLGCVVTGQDPASAIALESGIPDLRASFGSLATASGAVVSVVAPLCIGSAVLATLAAATGYFAILLVWGHLVRRARRRRRSLPAAARTGRA